MTSTTKFDPFQSQRQPDEVELRWSETPAHRPGQGARGAARAFPFALAMSFLMAGSGQAVVIGFSEPLPVAVVNEPVRLSVTLDRGNSGTHSLFSYGISVLGDWESLGIVPLGVSVPSSLDFNGVAGPGAFIGQNDAFIGVKGTVNLSGNPIELYEGTVLAEFEFRFTQPGLYELALAFFNTLGPTEDIFVNQDGVAIDEEIEFRSGLVQVVVPEPGISALLLAGGVYLLLRRGRMRREALPR